VASLKISVIFLFTSMKLLTKGLPNGEDKETISIFYQYAHLVAVYILCYQDEQVHYSIMSGGDCNSSS
jgi:hypothetical protein